MVMHEERLPHRAQQLLGQMAGEIERHEGKSALGRLLADAIAAGRGAEAHAIHTAMHWAPAVVDGKITEAELVRGLDGFVSHELMATAVAGYREILCNVAQRWAGAIANGYVTEETVVEELGMPADVVSAAVTKYKRVCAEIALTEAADKAEQLVETFRSVVTRK
jgi:hypothetical protein